MYIGIAFTDSVGMIASLHEDYNNAAKWLSSHEKNSALSIIRKIKVDEQFILGIKLHSEMCRLAEYA